MAGGLETAIFGRTGLEVTRLGYGAMAVSGVHHGRTVTEDEARSILNAVLDAGINFIDTAIDYGHSEEFIGKFISHRRSEFTLATKCGCPVGVPPDKVKGGLSNHTYTRESIVAGIDQSLARLKTDHLDVVQFHGPPPSEAVDDAVQTLCDLRSVGKVRFIGLSQLSEVHGPEEHLSNLQHLSDDIAGGVYDAFQIPYAALLRQNEDLITAAAEAGSGTMIRRGVALGEPGQGRGRDEIWQKFHEAKLDELREEGESRSGFMLRFTLSHPSLHTTIVGTKNPEHLRENVRAAQRGPLSEHVYQEAKRRLDGVGVSPAMGS
jgi:aryl-alcohol dehydrogenase-like predicted oxidoreductase